MIPYNHDVEPLLVTPEMTLMEAFDRLEQSKQRLLIAVDQDRRFLGVVGEGDIRRAILAGVSVNDPLAPCIRSDSIFVNDQTPFERAVELFSNRVHVLPVLDGNQKVVGYFTSGSKSLQDGIRLNRVGIIGMGYVGLTLAVSLAARGVSVIGYDNNADVLRRLDRREAPFYELGLQDQLDVVVGKSLHFADSVKQLRAEIYVVAVGTPVNPITKEPELGAVRAVAAEIGQNLTRGNAVIMRSTLPVGCCRDVVLPALEKHSGLKAGVDFFFAFAPERTVEGRALPELRTNPQIIGGFDQQSIAVASRLFNVLTRSVVDVGSLEAAELCKLIDNSYRDHIFAFANQLAPLTESLGLDLTRIVEAVNFGYNRNHVPRPSPGVGGPCLSKDPYILMNVLERYQLNSSLVKSARMINESGPKQVVQKLHTLLGRAGKSANEATISLVGLAFKGEPETSDLRDSTSIFLAREIGVGSDLRAYDPIVSSEEITRLGIRPVSLEEAFDSADAVIVLNNHKSYSNWNLTQLLSTMRQPSVFIDTWHIFDPLEFATTPGILYGGVGND